MGYYEDMDWIQKIWDPIDKKIRKVTFVTFNKTFGNKANEELLKSLANDFNQDDSDQKLNTRADTDCDSDCLESIPQIQKLPELISPLLSLPSSSLRPRLPKLSYSA